MALRNFWGFDALPTMTNIAANRVGGNGLVYNSYGLRTETGNSTSTTVFSSIVDGWITFDSNTTPTTFKWRVQWTAKDQTDGVSPYSHFGFTYARMGRGVARVAFDAGTALLWLGANALLYHSDLPNLLDTEFKIEVTINRISKSISVFIDGKLIRMIKTAGVSEQYDDGTAIYFGHLVSKPNTGYMSFRDFYFIDDTGDNTPCQRLGRYKVETFPIVAVEAVGWTSTVGDIGNSITTSLNTSQATPLATTGVEPTNINYQVSSRMPPSTYLVGFSILCSAKRDVGSSTGMQAGIKTESLNLKGQDVVFKDSKISYNIPVLLTTKNPQGTVLTDAGVVASTLFITPK